MGDLKWADFSEQERWKVWWGIAWRNIVVYIGFTVLLLALITCSGPIR